MPFLDSLDIANRTCQHVGVTRIQTIGEDSKQYSEISFVYDKVRRAELRRNAWRFSVKRTALRSLTTTTMLLVPTQWNANTLYLPGSIVSDANGILWVSTKPENIGNNPASTFVWDQYFGPMTADAWDSTQSYLAGELVYVVTGNPGAYVVFTSIENGNTDNPLTTTAWSSTTTYGLDQVVSFSGSQWRSLIAFNLNISPAQPPLNWDPTATYASGNTVVASDGYIYSSNTNGNIGHDPTQDAVNWTNTTVPAAWSAIPALFASSPNWLPVYGGLTNIAANYYPVGAGPNTQAFTRNAYRLPAGYLRRVSQVPKAGINSILGAATGRASDDWEFDGDYIVTSEVNPIMFRFVADINDVTKMDDMFCEGFAARMGLETCESLTQSTSKLQNIASMYKQFMGDARTVNAIEEGPDEPPVDDWISCRV